MENEDLMALLHKHAINIVGPMIHDTIDEGSLIEILIEMGDKWKVVWESIPTERIFDELYAINPRYQAFLYNEQVYELHKGRWQAPDSDVMEWLLEHPPFECCRDISDLFLHSQGMTAGASPWLLMQYIIGIAITSQGMGLNSLMGIGVNDGVALGKALQTWGAYSEVVDPYIELLLVYGAEEE